ncbi:magnesium transporter [Marinagarivorans algicola]|uniref:magnesium transporter n=1 Tax=Marinagarivorans algicola TaxID=1513270 RepID=UPI0006B4EC9D|nr:magnesium transporter [Marinagarivorans algicola]
MPTNHQHSAEKHVGHIHNLLQTGALKQVKQSIRVLSPVQLARVIESSPPPTRKIVWELIGKKTRAELLEELPEDIQAHYLAEMNTADLVELTEVIETDDIVDILQNLPDQITQQVLEAMSDQDRERVTTVLAYPENTAGGLTNTDTITVRPKFTLDVVLRYLRRHDELPPSTDSLIVVNKKDMYLGLLPLSTLLTQAGDTTVREVMLTEADPIPADMPDTEVAKLFEQNDWVSAPVVNEQGKLIGRITIDDVVDVIRETADHSFMGAAGLDEEEDTFATTAKTTPRRALWLGINLLTALLASSVINLFQGTIDKVVALAVLMPIVASMGGVAGSQTLTVVIRGMALGHISRSNLGWLLSREVRVGFLNGVLWALIMAAIAGLWFSDWRISFIIATAMVINLITAAFAGALLPIGLKNLRIDPALAGGVTLTTITDVVGFFAFLGLATLFYA